MEKFSVKKPFTILVMVIMIITLGFVAVTRLSTDLLPQMTLPYLMVITPYPGASPEKVESNIGVPMERALGTITGVKNVMTANADNYCMTQLEFEDGTDMDSALVKVSGAVDEVSGTLPEEAATPSMMEISMDMMATMYVAVSRDGYDIYELTDYVRDEVVPYMERQNGVARVSTIGAIDKSIQVELNQDKIDKINDRVLGKANTALADARKQLDDAEAQVQAGQDALESQEKSFGQTVASSIFDQIKGQIPSVSSSLNKQLENAAGTLTRLSESIDELTPQAENSLDGLVLKLEEAQQGVKDAESFLKQVQQAMEEAAKRAASAQETVDDAAVTLDNTVDQADQTIQTLENLPEEIQNAMSDPEALAALLDRAQQALTEAQAAEEKARQDLAAAREKYTAAYTKEQIARMKTTVQSVLTTIEKVSTGSASTFSDLMGEVSAVTTVLAKAGSAIDAISAEDTAGALTDKILDVRNALENAEAGLDQVPELLGKLETGFGAMTQAQLDAAVGFSTAAMQLSAAQAQLKTARSQYESSRDAALENANIDQLVTAETLSSLIYAQNFAMPAGYIDDENDNSWLLKVGEQFDTPDEIEDALLVDLDSVGVVRLSDVADLTIIDNAEDSYAKLNGENAICLCIYKASTAGTNEVSKTCKQALDTLAEGAEGLQLVSLMDQGIYIDLIVSSILSSILLGALLAIIVLILFLKDIRPTLVVGISIPLSVLFTIVLMYFSGLSLNMMTLSGLALGIGMLVDNSIVVMENIFRLRGLGFPAPRAAVQGAKQVRGAIIASTLTTVCVFLPMVFTTGTVRELLIPMALSIGYCLMASLVVALTVVPASASTIMRNMRPKTHRLLDRIAGLYGKSLSWCLRFKIIPLALAILLLVMTVWQVIRTGIVLLPEMASSDIEVDITTDEGLDRKASYRKMDEVIDRLLQVEGVNYIGALDMASSTALISSMAGDTSEYGTYMCYVIADEQADPDRLRQLTKDLQKAGDETDGCTVTVTTGDMSDMTALSGSDDLTIQIYGTELEQLTEISADVQKLIQEVPGFTDIKDSTENGEKTLQLSIDRDKAMEYGFTTAQIYAAIAARMNTRVQSTSITTDGMDLTITIVDETDPLTRENLLDLELTETDLSAAAAGNASSGAGGMSGTSGSMSTGSTSGMDASGMAGALSGNSSASGASDSASAGTSGGMDLSALFGGSDDEASGSSENAEASSSDEENEEDKVHHLSEFATVTETESLSQINRQNQTRYLTVTANAAEGQNAALLTRQLTGKLNTFRAGLPNGYRVEITGQSETITDMITQMAKLLALGILFIYLVMVAQFQSLLSPFIVLFTVPLAFTGGMIGLMIARQPLSMLSLMGFLILVGTVVNNGIVFVDYANQLRIGGMPRKDALVATGITRMRPIIMTALTTILAMSRMIFGKDMGSQLGSGMAIVITGGLLYATLMTLYIIPVLYDIFFRRQPMQVDTGDDLDEVPDDAAHFLSQMRKKNEA
ncbi:MAG: efflux RND transporter permease subunit [Eubacterium sp.]|nr:efflux RND transporter permease subunit [Eubacterium sp.]